MKLKNFLLVLLMIASGIVIVLFKSKVETLRIYVDEHLKKTVTKILNGKRIRYDLVGDKGKGVVIFEANKVVIPPNEEIFHLDWSERVKEKAWSTFHEVFGDMENVYISASSSEVTREPIVEKAVEIFTSGKGREYFENGFSILPIYFLVKRGKAFDAIFVYDPVTGEGRILK